MMRERELAECDWVVFESSWRVLHYADIAEWPAEATTACGRTGWLVVPGMFTRMGAPRCKRCCAKLGYPEGIGSPKNDEACKAKLAARLAIRKMAR